MPARLPLICSRVFLPRKRFILIDSLRKVQDNSAAASSRERPWPWSLLVFLSFSLSAEMKELHAFSLDRQFIFNWRGMKVKHLESEVQTPSIQECRDLLSCFSLQNVLCPCTSSFLCFSPSCVAHGVPGLYVHSGCQI